MLSHRLSFLLISLATVTSLLVAFVPGLQPPSWHDAISRVDKLETIPLLGWLATEAEAKSELPPSSDLD